MHPQQQSLTITAEIHGPQEHPGEVLAIVTAHNPTTQLINSDSQQQELTTTDYADDILISQDITSLLTKPQWRQSTLWRKHSGTRQDKHMVILHATKTKDIDGSLKKSTTVLHTQVVEKSY